MKKFKRAGSPDDVIVLTGAVWSDVADVLEWVQGLSVSAPLEKRDTPGGLLIALRQTLGSKVKRYALQSLATGAGKYWLREVSEPATDVDPATDLVAADLGAAGTVDVLGVNAWEVDGTGHDLSLSSSFKPQYFFGYEIHTNADGTKVVQIVAAQDELCTPAP